MDSTSNPSSLPVPLRVHPRTERRARASLLPAFTLIEVIVVIVMLAVLAGIVLPRMAGSDSRLADAQAQRVASVLSIVGWRGAVAPEPMELEFDPVSDSIRLLVNRAAPGQGDDPATPPVRAWRVDPIVAPVVLDRLSVQEAWWGSQLAPRTSARAGSGSSGLGAWRISIPADRPREPIVLVLADKSRTKDGVSTYRVELVPGRTTARVTPGDAPPAIEADRAGGEMDLDALGLGEQPW